MAMALAASSAISMIGLALVATLVLPHARPIAARGGASLTAPPAEMRNDSSYTALVQRAKRATSAQAWNAAAELWRSALLVDDRVGEHWVALAEATYRAQRYRESVSACERAMQLGALQAEEGAWRVARAYAQLGNATQSARWVELALRARRNESPQNTSDGTPAHTGLRRV